MTPSSSWWVLGVMGVVMASAFIALVASDYPDKPEL